MTAKQQPPSRISTAKSQSGSNLTRQILIALLAGVLMGLFCQWRPIFPNALQWMVTYVFKTGGDIFLNLIQMLVVPVVLISLIAGCSHLKSAAQFGRIGGKTFLLYLITTSLAVALALMVASLVKVGAGLEMTLPTSHKVGAMPSLQKTFINIFPSNPVAALASAHMLQVIVFALLFGLAIVKAGQKGERVKHLFESLNTVVMQLVTLVLTVTPYGVFCLLAVLFAQLGLSAIGHLLSYFMTVALVLLFQLFLVYPLFLYTLARVSPIQFFRQLYPALLFAFSVSSSNASIPIVLKTVEEKLGVANRVASFVIPMGSTINMDGTAIMQGVATVFIAHAYHLAIGWEGYLMVITLATLASIGTAGVPSVGLITLSLVLEQVGLPVEGVALIIGVDRLLDMLRTVVNVTGDAMISCVVANSERALDREAMFQ